MTTRTSLRHRVWEDQTCGRLFEQAEILSNSLLSPGSGKKQTPPFFTDHGPNHCRKVEAILDELVFGSKSNGRMFDPTPEEAMYLLAATWLHDIGMVYGIFPGETLEGLDVAFDKCRNYHERRSATYLQDIWQYNCDWSRGEKISLGQLCVHHRRSYSLAEMEPIEAAGRTSRLRLRELAALLRIADACHIDETRVPIDLKNWFTAAGMPVEAKEHWGLPLLVHSIDFDHDAKTIWILCYIPRKKRFGTATIDFQPAVDRLAESLRQELSTVIPYLSSYSNTDFKFVEAKVEHPHVIDPDHYLHEMWPCMLSTAVTANSIASMVGAILLATVRNQRDLPTNAVTEVIQKAVDTHPYNVLVRHLHAEMVSHLQKKSHPSAVEQYLEDYGLKRETACHEIAAQARQKIHADDVLILYGYSNVVMTLLTRHLRTHKKRILIVRCRRSDLGAVLKDENERMAEELRDAGLLPEVVEMAALQLLCSRLREAGIRAKVLLGTRGVLNNGDVLSPVGTAMVAMTARNAGIRVLIITEPEKITRDDDLNRAMVSLLNAQGADWIARTVFGNEAHPTSTSVAPIDRLSVGMYDELIGAEESVTPEVGTAGSGDR